MFFTHSMYNLFVLYAQDKCFNLHITPRLLVRIITSLDFLTIIRASCSEDDTRQNTKSALH